MFGHNINFQPDRDIPDLSGRVIIVTGGNVGLGLESIRQFAKHNPAHIYLAARSKEKAEAAIDQIKASDPSSAPISFLSLDLSSFDSIAAAARAFNACQSRLDILLNNAGIMMTAEGQTKEGYEIQFGTNHMGHALLIQLLLPVLQETAKSNPETRVINLSSASELFAPTDIYKLDELKTKMTHRSTQARYSISKIANIHYTSALAHRYTDIKFISLHPGMVATNLHHNASGMFLKPFLNLAFSAFAAPAHRGALNQLWASVSPDVKTGEYYAPVGVSGKGSKLSRNRELQDLLWDWTQDEIKGCL